MADSGGGRGREATPPGAGQPPRPTISSPPCSAYNSPSRGDAAVGEVPSELSPRPLTPISSLFFDDVESESQFFAQLVQGAMNSFAGAPPPQWALVEEPKEAERDSEPSLIFTVPPGFSPSRFLDSPSSSPDSGNFGMSHQLVVAQDTAQDVQSQFQMHNEAGCSSSLPVATAASLAQNTSSPITTTSTQEMSNLASNTDNKTFESAEGSHSDQRSQPTVLIIEKPPKDGYKWRTNGQKKVEGCEYTRRYHKCTHPDCPATKMIQRSVDGPIISIVYRGLHNHPRPQPKKHAQRVGELNENPGINPADSEPDFKRRKIPDSLQITKQPTLVIQTRSQIDLLDDGYKWCKYMQKRLKGNPNPRWLNLQSGHYCRMPDCFWASNHPKEDMPNCFDYKYYYSPIADLGVFVPITWIIKPKF